MYYWEVKNEIIHLKRKGEYNEAMEILLSCIEFTLEKHRLGERPLYVWPFEQATIVLRKLGRLEDEKHIVERFLRNIQYIAKGRERKIVERWEKINAMLGKEPDRSIFSRRALVVDVETTGLKKTDEIIEFAGCLLLYDYSNGRIVDIEARYEGLREPSVSISAGALRKHGLTKFDLKGKRLDVEKIVRLFDQADIVIAHNAAFDRRYTAKIFPFVLSKLWFCTMSGIDWAARGAGSRKLSSIMVFLGIKDTREHRAAGDVDAVVKMLMTTDGESEYPIFRELISSHPLRKMRL